MQFCILKHLGPLSCPLGDFESQETTHVLFGLTIHVQYGLTIHVLFGLTIPVQFGLTIHVQLGLTIHVQFGLTIHVLFGLTIHVLFGLTIHVQLGLTSRIHGALPSLNLTLPWRCAENNYKRNFGYDICSVSFVHLSLKATDITLVSTAFVII
jgi:hypothetical protein